MDGTDREGSVGKRVDDPAGDGADTGEAMPAGGAVGEVTVGAGPEVGAEPFARPAAAGGRRWVRWAWFGVLVAVAGLAALVLGTGFGRDPRVVDSAHLDQPAPPLVGATLAGGRFDLADYDGQVRVVNVWASWCAACEQEHPELIRAARRLQDRPVQFVGLNVQDDPDDARGMLDEMGHNPYPSVVDEDGSLAIDWGVFGVPETFLVDGDGVVRAKQTGPVTEQWLLDAVGALLAANDPGAGP